MNCIENNMNERTKIIGKLWKDLHGIYDSFFYWSDDTETEYFYDEKTDTIMATNGFCVPVEVSNEKLTKKYISDLIDKLEAIIVFYYRYVLNHELREYD